MKPPDRAPPSLEILEGRAVPASLAPTTLTDSNPARANTLRHAVLAANADTTADDFTISLRAGTYKLTRRNTAGQENAAALGDLDVTTTNHKVVIVGRGTHGRRMTVIDATALRDRIFHLIGPGVRLELQNLVLRGGVARDDGTDRAVPGDGDAQGGAVLNRGGSLTLINVLVTGNQAVGSRGAVAQGGGLFSAAGTVVLGRNAAGASSLTKNSAIGSNGAATGGSLFSGAENGSSAQGGGLYVGGGTVTITGASFVGNIARGGKGVKGHSISPTGPSFSATGSDGGAGGSGNGGGLYSFGATVSLSLAAFSGNRAQGGTAGAGTPAGGAGGEGGVAGGGGVFTDGGLTVSDTTFVKNVALGAAGGLSVRGGAGGAGGDGTGGGILAEGDLRVERSTLWANVAIGGVGGNGGTGTGADVSGGDGGAGGSAQGGGLHTSNGAANLANLTFAANAVQGGAGAAGGRGIVVTGTSGTTSAGMGGTGGAGGSGAGAGLYSGGGTVTLVSSTFSANTAAKGAGGARGRGPTRDTGGTPGAAGASQGGGIAGGGTVRNTLSAGNKAEAGPDFFGTAAAASGNLLGNGDGSTGFDAANGNQVGTATTPIDPKLGKLARNGGPTATYALLPGSPALDAGDDAASPGATDQRGAIRAVNGIDIGAVEVQADLSLTGAESVASVKAGGKITYSLTVTNLGPDPASSLVLTSAVPTGATFVSLTVPRGWRMTTPAAGGTGAITATLPALAKGGRARLMLVVRVGAGATGQGPIDFTATIGSALDPVAGNNAVNLSVPVVA